MFGVGKNVWGAGGVYPDPAMEPWMGINLGTEGNEVTGVRIKVAGWVHNDGSWKVGLPCSFPYSFTLYAPIPTTRQPVPKVMCPRSTRNRRVTHTPRPDPPEQPCRPQKVPIPCYPRAPSPPEFSGNNMPYEHFRVLVSVSYLISPPRIICSAPRILNASWQENYPVSIYVGDSRDWTQNCPCVLDVTNFSHPQASLVGAVSGSINHVVGFSDVLTAPNSESILPNSTVDFFCPTGTVGRFERYPFSALPDWFF